MPVLMQVWSRHASALKLTDQAGRRGGESIARRRGYFIYFLAPERVVVAQRENGGGAKSRHFIGGC